MQITAPLHDPDQEGALVLYPSFPNESLGMDQVQVVVDPRIALDLEKHQIEAVVQAYRHLTSKDSAGFIFADAPGLGKTLQCLTVLWTLITQSKFWDYKQEKVIPTIQKAIIICPKQVIPVWKQQIKIWLMPRGEGPTTETLKILVIDDKLSASKKKEEATKFMTNDSTYQTLICSYETFVILGKKYQKNNNVNDPLIDGPLAANDDHIVGLLVLDEAHYIKNASTERFAFVTDFPVKKRIAITGTPMQNNFIEYYNILKWLEPHGIPIIKDRSFKEMYGQAIQDWIDGGKNPTETPIELKRFRSLVRPFRIRRSANPFVTTSNTEFIICCKMRNNFEDAENLQKRLYNAFTEGFKKQQQFPLHQTGDLEVLNPTPKKRRKKQDNGQPGTKKITGFEVIYHLKSICAHPLFKAAALKKLSSEVTVLKDVHDILTKDEIADEDPNDSYLSAKLIVLKRLLEQIKSNNDKKDRVVIVSSSTESLALVEEMLKRMEMEGKEDAKNSNGSGLIYPFRRFDGNTSTSMREKIIANFNDLSTPNEFIITLSSRAGGTGISLIGK